MLKFKDEATEAERNAAIEGVRSLPAEIPEIVSYVAGFDAGLAQGNYDLCVVADFSSEDDYLTYADHPVHQQVIASQIRPILAGRAAIQFDY